MALSHNQESDFDRAYKAENRAYVPWATVVVIAINVIVFAAEYLGPTSMYRLIASQALSSNVAATGAWYTLLTSMFIHGSITHILCNMVTLYWIGMLLERIYGSVRFTVLYFVAGIVGGLVFAGIDSALGIRSSAVGASGAIYGLFAAYAYLLIRESKQAVLFTTRVSRADVMSFLSVIGINVLVSLTPGIAWEAHLGGFIGGLVCGIVLYDTERRAVMKALRNGMM
ncbi:MAG: rhomboid family intramembrane serine protease [Eggerthellaceae bacterium]|jgi:rhomboid protease GluP